MVMDVAAYGPGLERDIMSDWAYAWPPVKSVSAAMPKLKVDFMPMIPCFRRRCD